MVDSSAYSVRLATEQDVPALHRLVREAYREHIARGLNFTGTYQDESITRERMEGNDVYLMCQGDEIIATVTLGRDEEKDGVFGLYVTQLAVTPSLKRQGLGRWLLRLAAERGREQGAAFLRLDTAMPAAHLISLYQSEGFAITDEVQWEGKAYKSYIMEKRL
ncbi:MAG: putative N-acetyltransferase YvbK [Firmicutes bacterium]|nr:putative N-acetyltransferase YvbK [candidate division NPL-UPA2 bacterium]MBT9156215.1 putative N-acetyltransferase YvbK [candidate division NPL-UPA2 bacterium]